MDFVLSPKRLIPPTKISKQIPRGQVFWSSVFCPDEERYELFCE